MTFGKGILVAVALAVMASPGTAQSGADGAAFVKAVRERDADKAIEMMRSRGGRIVNAKDDSGDTALIAAIGLREDTWTAYLLREGADPNLAGRNGETPLIAAARIGYLPAIHWLLGEGAKVDQANRMGETPLIVAVQQRQVPVVKLLLARGANPDKPDSAAGYSARDYAKRDTRNRELLRLIEAAGAAKPALSTKP